MKDYSRFISELTTGKFFVKDGALDKYLPYLIALQQGKSLEFAELPKLSMGLFDGMGFNMPETNDNNDDNVAVIPINGVLTRDGSWWDYGTNDISELICDALENTSISAVVLKFNCAGGSTDAIFPIKGCLPKKNKPIIGAIDGGNYSLGYYVAAMACDKIMAIDNMCQVGSIGVMATYINWDGAYEQMGAKKSEVYAPESNWKNKAIRDLKAGNESTLITEELSPWAQHFQDVVRKNRPNLNETIEGTLAGRTFFANYGAVNAKVNGLIDDVMPMDEIIQYAFNLSKLQKAKSLF